MARKAHMTHALGRLGATIYNFERRTSHEKTDPTGRD